MKLIFTLGIVALASIAAAQYTTYDLSAITNSDVQNYTGGYNYPLAGGGATVSGVPLLFSGGTGLGTGIIALGNGNSTYDATLNIGQSGVAEVYTFINSAYGASGTDIGSVTLNGSTGSSSFDLIEGFNVRDHYDGFYNNSVTNVAGTQYFVNGAPAAASNPGDQIQGGDRVDMQAFAVDPSIGTLDSITFHSYNTSGGDPLIFGVTTSTQAVPEPAPIIALGLGIVVLLRRRSA